MTVATNTTTTTTTTTDTTTEAPEGFVSLKKLGEVAEAAKAEYGWCDEIDSLVMEAFGLDLSEVGPKVQLTITLPGVSMDAYSGRGQWMTEDGELRTEDYDGTLSHALYTAIVALTTLKDRATHYRESGSREQARKVLSGAKVELIRADEK